MSMRSKMSERFAAGNRSPPDSSGNSDSCLVNADHSRVTDSGFDWLFAANRFFAASAGGALNGCRDIGQANKSRIASAVRATGRS